MFSSIPTQSHQETNPKSQGMSICDVMTCFLLQFFPVDRAVVLSQLDTISNGSPSRSAGMPYVPLCTPSKGNTTYPPYHQHPLIQPIAITFFPGKVEGF